MNYPKATSTELVIQEVDDEVLVYDYETHRATCLDSIAHAIWKQCDGKQSELQIAAAMLPKFFPGQSIKIVQEIVEDTIVELHSNKLLEEGPGFIPVQKAMKTRRTLLAGAVAGAVPIVFGLTIPAAAQGASCLANGQSCTANDQCCSGVCNLGSGNPKCKS